jgi:transposase InsO family protein
MDAYWRRVVGWELGEDLRAELALNALNRALADRPIEPGIVHHSDRGVQYCSQTYVERLQAYGFVISMSRTGNPYDNAKAIIYEDLEIRRGLPWIPTSRL